MLRAFIGIALNLLLLPVGYYYLRHIARFVGFALIAIFVSPLLALFHYLGFQFTGAFGAMIAFVVATLLWQLFLIVDTYRAAFIESYEERDPAHAILIPGVIIMMLLFITFVSTPWRETLGKVHSMGTSDAMRPTLLPGDYPVSTGMRLFLEEPARGDLVFVALPGHPGLYPLRIYGLPGERVTSETIVDGGGPLPFMRTRISIDGQPIPQNCKATGETATPPVSPAELTPEALHKIMPARDCLETVDGAELQVRETMLPASIDKRYADVTLSADQYFVIGDNRDTAYDSRSFGPVSGARISQSYQYTAFSLAYEPPPGQPTECDTRPYRLLCMIQNPGHYRLRDDRTGMIAR
jgi:signal peptidase I